MRLTTRVPMRLTTMSGEVTLEVPYGQAVG
jgi:hypothetical protein